MKATIVDSNEIYKSVSSHWITERICGNKDRNHNTCTRGLRPSTHPPNGRLGSEVFIYSRGKYSRSPRSRVLAEMLDLKPSNYCGNL